MTYRSNSDATYTEDGGLKPTYINKRSLDKTNKYLKGLDLPIMKNTAEQRAAKIAWDEHDVASTVPVIGTFLATIVAVVVGDWAIGVVVVLLGVLLTLLIRKYDEARVMADAVLDVRDKERPSLINEEERKGIEDAQT